MKRRFKILPNLTWLALSTLITLTLLVPGMYLAAPHLYRWVTLSNLTATQQADRQQALNYVASRADSDARIRRGAIARLSVEDRDNFLQIVRALDAAGVWSRDRVGDEPWLRWLVLMAREDDAVAKVTALQRLANMPGRAADQAVLDTLARLAEQDKPAVRRAALTAAAQFVEVVDEPQPLVAIIADRTRDREAAIARQAWILLGLIDPAGGYPGNWRDAPPEAAEALLWAVGRTNPDGAAPLLAAARDAEAEPAVRAMALYALHQAGQRRALANVSRALLSDAQSDKRDTHLSPVLAHRMMRVIDPATAKTDGLTNADSDTRFVERVQQLSQRLKDAVGGSTGHRATQPATAPATQPRTTQPDEPIAAPQALFHAALHSLGPHIPKPAAFISDADQPGLARLAVAEGLTPPIDDIALESQAPLLLRAITVKLMPNAEPALLSPLWNQEVASMRDLACVLAARHFNEQQNVELIQQLTPNLNDLRKQSGAILSGLTGLETKLLRKREAVEDMPIVKRMMRLGLWMQGEMPAMSGQIRGLLSRDDVPRSTVLLALLSREPGAALEYLLHDPGYSDAALVDFFDRYRWWSVLKPALPNDAPPFWYWADRRLQRFQVQALRQWYLLNRHTLTGQTTSPYAPPPASTQAQQH
jgi:hypothetical protein